jgi:hypothetical protein
MSISSAFHRPADFSRGPKGICPGRLLDCRRSTQSLYPNSHLTALASRQAVPPLWGSRSCGFLSIAFVLACFASASPEALILRTASQASSCIPALDVRKAHPLGPPSVATTRPSHGLVSAAWFPSPISHLPSPISYIPSAAPRRIPLRGASHLPRLGAFPPTSNFQLPSPAPSAHQFPRDNDERAYRSPPAPPQNHSHTRPLEYQDHNPDPWETAVHHT